MKSSLIFGSTAAKHFFPDFPRNPQDLDIIQREKITTRELQTYWWPTFSILLERNKDETYLDPEFLYLVKACHANWDIHWEKAMGDILFFQQKGLKFDHDLYKLLVKDFKVTHGKKWATLKGKDSETFFKDAVTRVIPHDDLHLICSHYERPLYERILKNPETKSVECSEEKFNALTEEDKVLLTKEEIFATMLERHLIPSNFRYSHNLSYARCLKKLITTMSSGYFSRWMIENYSLLRRNTDWSFVDKFKQKYNYD